MIDGIFNHFKRCMSDNISIFLKTLEAILFIYFYWHRDCIDAFLFADKHQFFQHFVLCSLFAERGMEWKEILPPAKSGNRSAPNIVLCQEKNLFNFIAFSISLPGSLRSNPRNPRRIDAEVKPRQIEKARNTIEKVTTALPKRTFRIWPIYNKMTK